MSDIFVLQREAGGEPFEFEVDGEKFRVKHTRDMNQFALADLFSGAENDVQFITGLLRAGMTEADVQRLARLEPSQPELAAIHTAYMAHCGMKNEGESSASSA